MSQVPAYPTMPGQPGSYGPIGPPAFEPPTEPLEYQEVLRRGPRSNGWWALLGVVAVAVLYLIGQAVVIVPFAIVQAVQGKNYDQITASLGGQGVATPSFLAVVNLSWAVAIPIVWLAVWLVHGLKPRWVESVRPRLRWGWLGICFGLALVALVATIAVSAVLPSTDDGSGSIGSSVNDFTSTSLQFLLVILILTPLQAAGEEHVFRGYLMQAFGAAFGVRRQAGRIVAVVASAFIFALLHGVGQGLEIFIDRFAFGLGAAVLVVVTGGLEAGIAMHVLNNFLAFGIALFFGDMTDALHATGGSWWGLISTVVQIGVWLGLTIPIARRRRLQTHTEPIVLAPQQAPV